MDRGRVKAYGTRARSDVSDAARPGEGPGLRKVRTWDGLCDVSGTLGGFCKMPPNGDPEKTREPAHGVCWFLPFPRARFAHRHRGTGTALRGPGAADHDTVYKTGLAGGPEQDGLTRLPDSPLAQGWEGPLRHSCLLQTEQSSWAMTNPLARPGPRPVPLPCPALLGPHLSGGARWVP